MDNQPSSYSAAGLKWALMALAFTPLIITKYTLFPLVFGKAVFIRLILTIFVGLLAIYLYKNRKNSSLINFSKLKNPIFLTYSLFVFLSFLSSIFADSSYRAFWGNIERSSSLLMLIYMWIFLAGLLLFFKRKEWLSFFKLSVLVGIVISISSIPDFFQSFSRVEGIFIGNAAFIAVYNLFTIFSAWIVLSLEKNAIWKGVSYLSIPLFIFTIMVTQTRGVLVGLLASFIAVSIYLILRGGSKRVKFLKLSIKVKSLGILGLLFLSVLSGSIYATRQSSIWQGIPGLNRLSSISLEDDSTATRIINIGISFDAVNPSQSGWLRTAFGWGPENYLRAHTANYDPSLQKHERSWFDRAHNALLDVLVMHGYLGLFVYLLMWFYILRYPFKKRRQNLDEEEFSFVNLGLIFFGYSYFVQNIFLFDHITSYVPLFIFTGFLISAADENYSYKWLNNFFSRINRLNASTLIYTAGVLFIIMSSLFIWTSYIPYNQMSKVGKGIRGGDLTDVVGNLDKIVLPNNYAQAEIRNKLLSIFSELNLDENVEELQISMLALNEQTIDEASNVPKSHVGAAYVNKLIGQYNSNDEFLIKSEEHLRIAKAKAYGRQSIMFVLADNLVAQGRFDEAIEEVNELYSTEPEGIFAYTYFVSISAPYDWKNGNDSAAEFYSYFVNEENQKQKGFEATTEIIRTSYANYLIYFAKNKDVEGFVMTTQQAIKIEQTIDRVTEKYSEMGFLDRHVESNVQKLIGGLEIFSKRGWDAIRI